MTHTPRYSPHLWVEYFPFPSVILQFWFTTGAARVQVAAVSRDRRGHCFTFIIESLFFPTPGITSVKPLRGEGMEKGEPRAKGFISVC